MADIIPRNKAIPVQARRRDPDPPMIQIPGADPIPIPPPQPGVTQNIIYVNMPSQTPPPQAPPPQVPVPPANPPQEIHIHNTHVHNYPRRRGQRLGSSFFGTLGLVLGGASMAAAYLPMTLGYAKSIAEAGAACSALGLLSAMVLGRVGRGLPFFALLVCGAGFGMWLKNTGQIPGVPGFDIVTAPQSTGSSSATPAPGSATPNTASPSAAPSLDQPSADPTRLHDHSFFGDGQGTWSKPSETTPTAPPPPVLSPGPSVAPAVSAVDQATATAKLEEARTAAAARLGLDYAGAKLALDSANSEYDQAKITNAPGSPELVAAAKKHLEAQSQLNTILAKLRSDPMVAAAEAAVKAP
jgi:hypothetical protein